MALRHLVDSTLALCVFLGGAADVVSGQQPSAIRGVVRMDNGTPLSSMRVVLVGVVADTVSTDDNGEFQLHDLRPGTYTLQVGILKFPPLWEEKVVVAGHAMEEIDIVLPSAGVFGTDLAPCFRPIPTLDVSLVHHLLKESQEAIEVNGTVLTITGHAWLDLQPVFGECFYAPFYVVFTIAGPSGSSVRSVVTADSAWVIANRDSVGFAAQLHTQNDPHPPPQHHLRRRIDFGPWWVRGEFITVVVAITDMMGNPYFLRLESLEVEEAI